MDNADLAALTQPQEEAEQHVAEILQNNAGDSDGTSPEELIAQGIVPQGYVRDRTTGEIRPSKRPGRKRNATPPPAPGEPVSRKDDIAPDSKVRGKKQRSVPRYQKGVIAAGMTKLYRRTGKIVKAIDRPIGIAIIESAEDCGEAWDELARTNPRVRAFCLKLVTGGAWGSLIMAHAPILMALIMKDGIRKHIPFMKLIEAVVDDDGEEAGDEISDMLGGIQPGDIQQMMGLAQSLMGDMSRRVPGTVLRGNSEDENE